MVVKAFETLVDSLRDKIIANVRESSTLAALRDALLPQLISGELRVPEAWM
jgi:type I restriction enzyme S subunit